MEGKQYIYKRGVACNVVIQPLVIAAYGYDELALDHE